MASTGSTLSCRNVSGIQSTLSQIAGAPVCGFIGNGEQPDTFSACCSGAIFNGSEVSAASQSASLASCLTYCITDLALSEFSSCLAQQSGFDKRSKTFCSGANDPASSESIIASASGANRSISSRRATLQGLAVLLLVGLALVLPPSVA